MIESKLADRKVGSLAFIREQGDLGNVRMLCNKNKYEQGVVQLVFASLQT